MPTRGREVLALKAVQSFNKQTYTPRELVVLDDEDMPSFPLGLKGPSIRYHRAKTRMTIAEKRNECCKLSNGDYIVHWDSDDWSAPQRIADQVKMLDQGLVSVVGFHSILFYDARTRQAYRFERERRYGIGTSLAYRKDFWSRHPFQQGTEGKNWGEDNQFTWTALQWRELDTVPGEDKIVALIHDDSTAPKDVRLGGDASCGSWRVMPAEAIPQEFFK